MRVKKGDKVKVLCGKDRGKIGEVIKVMPGRKRLIVENVNLTKKHRKARRAGEKSERITVAAPIDSSNVMLVCPKCSKAVRVSAKIIDDKKVRVCKKCKAEF